MFDLKLSEKQPAKGAPDEQGMIAAFLKAHNISADKQSHERNIRRGQISKGYLDSFSSAKRWYGEKILPRGENIVPVYITKGKDLYTERGVRKERRYYFLGVFFGPAAASHTHGLTLKPMPLAEIFKAVDNHDDGVEGGIVPVKPVLKSQSDPAAFFATGHTLSKLPPATFEAILGYKLEIPG